MTPPRLTFDHLVLGARDLESGATSLQRSGFEEAERGVHPGKGTANVTYRLQQGYLELLTVADREEALRAGGSRQQAVQVLDDQPVTILGLALQVDEFDTAREALNTAGVTWSGPHRMSRSRPDGTRVAWETLLLEDRQWRSAYPFLIRWDTPEAQRWEAGVPFHPNGVRNVVAVEVSAPNPEQVRSVYQALGAKTAGDALRLGDVDVRVRRASEPGISRATLDAAVAIAPPFDAWLG